MKGEKQTKQKKKKKRPRLISILYYDKPYDGYHQLIPEAYRARNNWRLPQEEKTHPLISYISRLEYTLNYNSKEPNIKKTKRARYDLRYRLRSIKLRINTSTKPASGRNRGFRRSGFLKRYRLRRKRYQSESKLETIIQPRIIYIDLKKQNQGNSKAA